MRTKSLRRSALVLERNWNSDEFVKQFIGFMNERATGRIPPSEMDDHPGPNMTNPTTCEADGVPQSGPRVTAQEIEALINKTKFTDFKIGRKTTVVHAELPNGFEITETSGCVDPANYIHEIGVNICKARIRDKIWLLEGYALQDRLFNASP